MSTSSNAYITNHISTIEAMRLVVKNKTHIDKAVEASVKPGQSTSMIMAIVSGTIRQYETLDSWANKHTKFKPKDIQLKHLLMSSLYQIKFMEKRSINTIIHSAAEVTMKINRSWAKPVIYAALKRLNQEAAPTVNNVPKWLEHGIVSTYGEKGLTACLRAWSSAPQQAHIRINPAKTTRDAYLEKLKALNIPASTCPQSNQCIFAPTSAISNLPGLDNGQIYIQDKTQQKVAEILPRQPDSARVLDACAAPGGKATAILNLQPNIQLLAVDISEEKINRLRNNLQTYPQAKVLHANALTPHEWWDGTYFDTILCDAPCSGTGVLQKHPEIKLIQSLQNIQELQKKQRALLQKLWKTLRPGGHFIYSTCSILPSENEDAIESLVRQDLLAAKLISSEITLPTPDQSGGFYALIQKVNHDNDSTDLSTENK